MAEFKHIVRIANTDIKGEKKLFIALQRIKGIGASMSNAICHASGIEQEKQAGLLSDAEENRLSEAILHPEQHGIPTWMFNRRNDTETGEEKHILLGDIIYTLDQEKKREMRMRSYKGIRYQARLPVRGQRTRSNFRPNKGKVTIKKKVNVIRK